MVLKVSEISLKPQLVIVVLKKIVKPQSVTVFKDISETTVKITILKKIMVFKLKQDGV